MLALINCLERIQTGNDEFCAKPTAVGNPFKICFKVNIIL